MRLDIPQELPRRREDADGSNVSSADRVPVWKVPENPLQQRLKQAPGPRPDTRHSRPRTPRRKNEPSQDVPRERRRPVSSGDPRRPARAATNIVGLELRPEEKQLLRETGRFR